MDQLGTLKDLVPAVAISFIMMGGFSYILKNLLTKNAETIAQIEIMQAEAHRQKVATFLDETKRKDQMLMDMVSGIFEKVNVSMEKQSTSLDKFTAVLEQFLGENRRRR